ncbi:hypothetical protein BOX15_Mlig033299g2 [Macrostomum lignano]|uniref:Uncharacterized protein n=1 Tax=Macrostomum lignano TaxID=282301 RepID=A0A267DR09_9PLAT|nr:hypothetical protein BOX15_Mlig033299g2 [Macrostomum lignano]
MDLPYCELCSEYFYTPIDYNAHLVSNEHLQKLLSFPVGKSASNPMPVGSNQEDIGELELVQSDFIYVSQHTPQLAQIYKVYQNHIRQMIPFGMSYILLLDAVPPSMWQGMISALNEFSVSFPLFVQSGSSGSPPADKQLMDFVLVVDIDPSTTAKQLAACIGARETDLALIPGDSGSDTTGFLRISHSKRQVVLDRIRSARVPPRQRQIDAFELWGPRASSYSGARSPTSPPLQSSLAQSPKLNKDVPGLLASLSSRTMKLAASSTATTSSSGLPPKSDSYRPSSPSQGGRIPSTSLGSSGRGRSSSSRHRADESRSHRDRSRSKHGSGSRRRSRSRSRERRCSRSRSRQRGHSRSRKDPQRDQDRNRDRDTRSDRGPDRNSEQGSGYKRRGRRSSFSMHEAAEEQEDDYDETPSCYLERTWSIKFGGMPYLRISGFDPEVDTVDLVDAVCSRIDGIESIYAFTHPKGLRKSVICNLSEQTPMPSVNQVKDKIGDLCSNEHLFAQDYTEEAFHQMKFNLPHTFFFVPVTKTRAFEPMFLLIWNIPGNVHPNHILYNMRRSMPSARSFNCPRLFRKSYKQGRFKSNAIQLNCGYAVARFNSSEDCTVMMQRLEEAAEEELQAVFSSGKVKFSFVCMQETCLIPPFSFPCHNFLHWDLDSDWDSMCPQDSLPDRPYVPFVCNCHTDSMPIAPHASALDVVAKHIVEQLAVDGPSVVCQKLTELLKLEDSCPKKFACVEDRPASDRVPPIELGSVQLGSASSYWCLLYGPDIYYTARGFPLSMDSFEIEEIVKRTCKAYCIYVHIYPQPVPQVLTKQAVFRCSPAATSSSMFSATRSLQIKLNEEMERLNIQLPDNIFVSEWSYRSWDKFKHLRPFMLPFCPVPNGYRKPHFILVWNINSELGKHVLVRNFLKKYPQVRSVFSPHLQPAQVCRNCEFCVLRFDNPDDCVRTYASMRIMTEQELQALCPRSDIRFILCRMEETCYIRPFLFPCHNFFFWYGRNDEGQTNNGDRLFVESWSRRFDCVCHPYCEALTPGGPQLLRFARMVHTAVEKSTCEAVKNCLLMYIEATQDATK